MEAQKKKYRFMPLIAVFPFRTGVTHSEILFDLIQIAKQGWTFLRIGSQRIDIARNRAVKALLENEEFTHLLMLDADQRHRPDMVQRLGRRVADDPTRLIVSALYYRRGEPYEPLAFNQDKAGHMYQLAGLTPGICKVDYLGTGCMLVAREVFERIEEPWFWYDYPAPGKYPSEDICFCRKCREAGIDLWLDTTIESAHHATKWITGKDWQESLDNDLMAVLFSDEVGLMDNPGTVLYVGARPKPECSRILDYLAEAGATIDLVEIWPENCEGFMDDERVRDVHIGDVRDIPETDELYACGYDWVVWWHGPEHIKRNELGPVIKDLAAMSNHILLGCPWGLHEQGEMYGNPHEKHLTHWQPEEFETLGFNVETRGEENDGNIIAWR